MQSNNSKKKQVLVIAQADSIHTIRKLQTIRAFCNHIDLYLFPSSPFPANPVFASMGITVIDPKVTNTNQEALADYWDELFFKRQPTSSPSAHALADILGKNNFDMVHIFALQQGAYLYHDSLNLLGEGYSRPFTLLSLWGNCIYYFSRIAAHKEWIIEALNRCDTIQPESERDEPLLRALGFNKNITEAIQLTFDWDKLKHQVETLSQKPKIETVERRIIAVRGSYPVRGRTFLALEALKRIRWVGELNYRVVVFGGTAIDRAVFEIDKPEYFFAFYEGLNWAEVQWLLSMSRLVISLNTTDGTPQLFYEAIASKTTAIFSRNSGLRQFLDPTALNYTLQLVDPNNIEEIIMAITDSITNPSSTVNNELLELERRISEKQGFSRLSKFFEKVY